MHIVAVAFPQSGPPNQTAKATLIQGGIGRAVLAWGQTDVERETNVALICVQARRAACLGIPPL